MLHTSMNESCGSGREDNQRKKVSLVRTFMSLLWVHFNMHVLFLISWVASATVTKIPDGKRKRMDYQKAAGIESKLVPGDEMYCMSTGLMASSLLSVHPVGLERWGTCRMLLSGRFTGSLLCCQWTNLFMFQCMATRKLWQLLAVLLLTNTRVLKCIRDQDDHATRREFDCD